MIEAKSYDLDLHNRIKELVAEQWEHIKKRPQPSWSNRSRVISRVQDIIYKDWGFSNNYIWELVNIYTEELISEELD